MGFSLTAALGAATPLLKSILPGGSGGTLGTIADIALAGFSSPATQVAPVPITAFAPAPRFPTPGGVQPASSGMLTRFVGRTVLSDILMQASENAGRRVTSKQIREAARHCGIDTAAATFGLSVEQVCTVISTRRRRRSRGISAADMRRTRSTIRKVHCIRKQIKALK